jgi:hypothetical protein
MFCFTFTHRLCISGVILKRGNDIGYLLTEGITYFGSRTGQSDLFV